jgi:DNA-binding transcriptional MocR family regulator
MVTIWHPRLRSGQGPAYRQLAESLAAEVRAGRLRAGDRLPPQRDLAGMLGVTVGTVTRAYQLAARQGLIGGEIGRGTYVLAPPGASEEDALDLSLNALPPHAHIAELAGRLEISGADRAALLNYPPRGGHEDHRAGGADWIARRGLHVPPAHVLVTVGAQHALAVALGALAQPEGPILVEEFTYTGIIAAARMLNQRLVPVGLDAEGLRADSLQQAARESGARTVILQPALHNPTGVSMSTDRRAAVLEVIRRERLVVVEDDTYGFLVPEFRPLVADLDGSWCYVTGLSKSLAAGYRTGFLAVSSDVRDRAHGALWATAIAASPISVSLAVSLIADGTADRIVAWKRNETRARMAMARHTLPDVPRATSGASPHIWLPLARQWRAAAFVAAARGRGILLGPTENFVGVSGAVPKAVRVSLGPPRTRERLQHALETLAALSVTSPSPAPTV